MTYDQKYGELPVPEYEYGKFLGWFTEEEGGDKVSVETAVSRDEDHTLFARYRDYEELLPPYATDAQGQR